MPWNILLSKDVQTRNLWLFYPILRRQVHRCSSYRFVVKDAFKIVHHIDQIHIFWWILCFMQQTEILGWNWNCHVKDKTKSALFQANCNKQNFGVLQPTETSIFILIEEFDASSRRISPNQKISNIDKIRLKHLLYLYISFQCKGCHGMTLAKPIASGISIQLANHLHWI